MQKYFIKKIINNTVSFHDSDEHHLLKVMRIQLNQEVIGIYNNKKYLIKINSLDPLRGEIKSEILEKTNNSFTINAFLASIKPKYLEWAIMKATELNVNNFYIFYSSYSQKNIKHDIDRYKRIIKEASEQSNRNDMMNLFIINDQQELIKILNKNKVNLIADLTDDSKFVDEMKITNEVGIIIGPEGGFSQKDYDLIFNRINNLIKVKLTKTILRAETALSYLVSVVSYILLKNEK